MLKVICGPMFSGKTEMLIREVSELDKNNETYVVYKPTFDDRYAIDEVVTHYGASLRCVPVENSHALTVEEYSGSRELNKNVFIDEIQFFDHNIILRVKEMLSYGKNVTVVGLDTNYQGEPFTIVGQLLAMADEVVKLKARCSVCGDDAGLSAKLNGSDELYELGSVGVYEPRCRKCFK